MISWHLLLTAMARHTSKRQEKQLFADWQPVILKTKVETRNGLSAKYNLPDDGREVWIRNKLDTNAFCWMKAENVEDERDSTRKCFWMTRLGQKEGQNKMNISKTKISMQDFRDPLIENHWAVTTCWQSAKRSFLISKNISRLISFQTVT